MGCKKVKQRKQKQTHRYGNKLKIARQEEVGRLVKEAKGLSSTDWQ